MTALKPCPFCGVKAKYYGGQSGSGVARGAQCYNSDCHLAMLFPELTPLEKVAEAWNQRARKQPVSGDEVEAVAHALVEYETGKKWTMTEAKAFIEWPTYKERAKAAIAAMPQPYVPFESGDTHCSDCPCRFGQHIKKPQPVEMGEECAVDLLEAAYDEKVKGYGGREFCYPLAMRDAFRALQAKARIVKREDV